MTQTLILGKYTVKRAVLKRTIMHSNRYLLKYPILSILNIFLSTRVRPLIKDAGRYTRQSLSRIMAKMAVKRGMYTRCL